MEGNERTADGFVYILCWISYVTEQRDLWLFSWEVMNVVVILHKYDVLCLVWSVDISVEMHVNSGII